MPYKFILAILAILFFFYVGRALFWKLYATVHDIRHNKQTVKQASGRVVLTWHHLLLQCYLVLLFQGNCLVLPKQHLECFKTHFLLGHHSWNLFL